MKRVGLVLAFAAMTAFAGEWTGFVSESKCGAAHVDGSEKSVNCVKACIKGGAKPVLVADGKVLKIANTDKVEEALYGLKVKVTGNLEGDTVTIESIAKAD
jgi:hypothetical protein